jgi:hypothetical protein
MDKKNNKDLQNQLKFEAMSDKPGSYLDDLEDIFAPVEEQEELINDKSIYWCRCADCERVITICELCHKPFKEGDNVYCLGTRRKDAVHYCEKCMKSWKIANACKPQKWKLTEKGKRYLSKHKPSTDLSG